jgi:truncated hemoglobin YjbI
MYVTYPLGYPTLSERDAWLGHMRTAVDSLGLDPEHEATL